MMRDEQQQLLQFYCGSTATPKYECISERGTSHGSLEQHEATLTIPGKVKLCFNYKQILHDA